MQLIVKLTLGVMLVAASLIAQQNGISRPLITVYGTADLKVVPDVIDVSIGVEIRGRELPPAIDQQTSRVAEAINLIKNAGVDAKDI
jgi:uncharacterized protein YggE